MFEGAAALINPCPRGVNDAVRPNINAAADPLERVPQIVQRVVVPALAFLRHVRPVCFRDRRRQLFSDGLRL
nr:hypothetical protein Itr_chr15CG16010 [Ipomoea trifida]